MVEEILAYLGVVDFRGHGDVDTHLPEYACAPETVAEAIAYLAGADYVHSEILNLNGGMQFR